MQPGSKMEKERRSKAMAKRIDTLFDSYAQELKNVDLRTPKRAGSAEGNMGYGRLLDFVPCILLISQKAPLFFAERKRNRFVAVATNGPLESQFESAPFARRQKEGRLKAQVIHTEVLHPPHSGISFICS